jgi:hypothetical protein
VAFVPMVGWQYCYIVYDETSTPIILTKKTHIHLLKCCHLIKGQSGSFNFETFGIHMVNNNSLSIKGTCNMKKKHNHLLKCCYPLRGWSGSLNIETFSVPMVNNNSFSKKWTCNTKKKYNHLLKCCDPIEGRSGSSNFETFGIPIVNNHTVKKMHLQYKEKTYPFIEMLSPHKNLEWEFELWNIWYTHG